MLNRTQLWELRKQIRLNSLFVADYENSFGIDRWDVCNFFDGYMSFLDQLVVEDGLEPTLDNIFSYDTSENLNAWYWCFADEDPLPVMVEDEIAA